jgi:MFS family permease
VTEGEGKLTLGDWLIVAIAASSASFLGMIFTTIAPVLPAVSSHFGGGDHGIFVAQWLLTAPSIGVIIGGPLGGWFVERLGARLILTICLIVFAVSGTAMLVIDNVLLIFISRFFVGLTAVGQLTAFVSMLGERYSSEMRGKVVGLQSAFAIAGGVILVLSTGKLAQLGSWRTPSVLYATAVPVLLASLILLRPAKDAPRISFGGDMKGLTNLIPTYLMVTITMMVTFIPTNQVPLLFAEDAYTDSSTVAFILSLGSIAMAVGGFSYSLLRRRFTIEVTRSIALSLLAAGLAIMAALHGIVATAAAMICLGAGGGLLTPLFSHHILDHAPPAIRGRALGFLFAAQFTGPIINSALIAPAALFAGRRLVIALVAVVLAVWVLGLLRNQSARRASAPSV